MSLNFHFNSIHFLYCRYITECCLDNVYYSLFEKERSRERKREGGKERKREKGRKGRREGKKRKRER